MLSVIRKLGKILNRKQKKKVVVLAIMIIVGGLLETVSISMILPIMQAIMSENALENNATVATIASILHIQSLKSFVVVMFLAMAVMFVLKNLYMLLLAYVQHRFITNNQYRTSGDLLEIFLNKPYSFYLNASTGDIIRTIYSDTTSVFSVLLQCLQILTEVIVALCLAGVILISDPIMTLVIAAVLVFAMVVTNLVMKKKMHNIGEGTRQTQSLMYKSILQSVTCIKDVKVFAKEKAFLNAYKTHGKRYYGLLRDSSVFGSLPKLVVETSCMSGIMIYLAIMILVGRDIASMIPQLTAFALAAVRLMPCASRCSAYLANIDYYKPALDYVYENVDFPAFVREREARKQELSKQESSLRIQLMDKIEVKDITFKYPNTEKYIFKSANMVVAKGQSVGIVGTSGAGKSTIVDIILGLLEAEEGEILCDGVDVTKNYYSWLSNLGYIPQTINLIDDTIRANIAFGYLEGSFDDKRVWEVLEEAQLKTFVEDLPKGLDTTIGERGVRLSGGQRQRIGIARALFHDPELLILDEATSALDNDTEAAIMEAINHFHGRKTMLIIAHRLKTIENCDIVYRVENGKIERER